MDRRDLLRLSAGALAAAVAGCQGNGDGTTAAGPDDGDDGASTPAPSPPGAPGTDTATAAAAPPTSDQSDATPTGTPGNGEPAPTAGATASPTPTATPSRAAQVVAVGDGELTFDPETFEVAVGETVVWVWHSSVHNVVPSKRPRGSTFSGSPGDEGELYDTGYEFAYTFETAGEYEYYCNAHRNVGMTGSFTVTE
ncbi:MAG: plastocyanin/azurin family copper-binding protein [Halosimplex sp.]